MRHSEHKDLEGRKYLLVCSVVNLSEILTFLLTFELRKGKSPSPDSTSGARRNCPSWTLRDSCSEAMGPTVWGQSHSSWELCDRGTERLLRACVSASGPGVMSLGYKPCRQGCLHTEQVPAEDPASDTLLSVMLV